MLRNCSSENIVIFLVSILNVEIQKRVLFFYGILQYVVKGFDLGIVVICVIVLKFCNKYLFVFYYVVLQILDYDGVIDEVFFIIYNS